MRIHGLIVALLLAATPCFGAPTNFECKFSNEASPNGLKPSNFALSFILDQNAGKAYMTGNAGSSEVQYVPNKYGITFIETTESGNVMVTAIAFKSEDAVHSRNGIIGGKVIPTQYYGGCSIR
jgi:hypothetical protein